MLKKVCRGVVISTISLLLTPCLSVVGMTLLLLLLVTIMEFFPSGFCEKNFCSSHFLCACQGLNEKGFLCSIKISQFCFLDVMASATWFLIFFPNRSSSCFCRSDAFSFNIDFNTPVLTLILLHSTFYHIDTALSQWQYSLFNVMEQVIYRYFSSIFFFLFRSL